MKYCSNCGAKLDDDARFCGDCGTPFASDVPADEQEVPEIPVQEPEVPGSAPEQPVTQEIPAQEEAPQEPAVQAEAAQEASQEPAAQEDTPQEVSQEPEVPQEPAPKAPKKPSKFGAFVKKHVALISVVAVLLVAAIGTGIYFLTRPTTIKLNDYIKVEYRGYDGFGLAEYNFDKEAFEADYGSKLKIKNSKAGSLEGIFDSLVSPTDLFEDLCVDGHMDKYDKLKNGDEIHYVWSCDDEAAKELFNVRLSYEDLSFTVEGLKEVKKVDPFEGLTVTFKGIAPYGEAECKLDSKEDYTNEFYFTITPEEDLKNGDTVTVTLDEGKDEHWLKYLAETYGISVTKTEQTYTVEGLDAYATDISQITEEAKTAIDAKVAEFMTEQAENVEGKLTISTPERVGFYLLNAKNPDYRGKPCQIYGTYKVTATTIPEAEGDATEEFSYYFAMRFIGPLVHDDGTVEIDMKIHDLPYARITQTLNGSLYFFNGFESLEKFEEDVLKSVEDTFTYTTDISK